MTLSIIGYNGSEMSEGQRSLAVVHDSESDMVCVADSDSVIWTPFDIAEDYCRDGWWTPLAAPIEWPAGGMRMVVIRLTNGTFQIDESASLRA